MNLPVTTSQPSSLHHSDCSVVFMASRAGAALFAVTVAALEAWLRVPLAPVIDSYLQEALTHVSSAAAFFRKPSF